MISVIIPTYNHGRYIGRTLESVLKQTYQEFELIVVNDGSQDNTEEIVKSFDDSRIRYIYQENQGACVARNRGIKEANGNYLLFEDSDDMMEPRHLEVYAAVASQNPGCNIYGPFIVGWMEENEFKVRSIKGKCPGDDLLEHWIGKFWIVPNCILWPRENVEKIGGWDESLHANQDGDIGMMALIAGVKFVFANDAPPAKHIRHEGEIEHISTTLNSTTIASRLKVLEKVEKLLSENDNLNRTYKNALAKQYFDFSKRWLYSFPEFSDNCFEKYKKLYGFRKPPGSFANWIMILLFGLRRKEKIAESIGHYVPWRF